MDDGASDSVEEVGSDLSADEGVLDEDIGEERDAIDAPEPEDADMGQRDEQEKLSGPVGIVMDVHYLLQVVNIPSDASLENFEASIATRCGGGPVCSRFACDSQIDSGSGSDLDSAPDSNSSRQRLHGQLRERGYELLIAPPRPLTGAQGATDADMATCILDVGRGLHSIGIGSGGALPSPATARAAILALVAGDADFSSVLRRVMHPRTARSLRTTGATDGREVGARAEESITHSGTLSANGVEATASVNGLHACVILSEPCNVHMASRQLANMQAQVPPSPLAEPTAEAMPSVVGGASGNVAGGVGTHVSGDAEGGDSSTAGPQDLDIRYVDLLGVLPSLVPGLERRDAKVDGEKWRRLQTECLGKLAARETEMSRRREAREAERSAKRRAKAAEDEAKREMRAREHEERRKKREEEKEEKRRAMKLKEAPSEAQREKWRMVAAKKGFTVGMRVEAPLLNGGTAAQFDGSWYMGSVVECEARGARIKFERAEGLPLIGGSMPSADVSALITSPAAPHVPTGAPSVTAVVDGVTGDDYGEDNADLECVVPYESMRPVAPLARAAPFEACLDLGCFLEMRAEGGWWEVELLGTSSGPLAADMAVEEARGGEGGAAQYTVRLLSAPSESVGVYELGIDELRPGWQWRGGKWSGMWCIGAQGELTLHMPGKQDGGSAAAERRERSTQGGGRARVRGGRGRGRGRGRVAESTTLEDEASLAQLVSRWPVGSKVEVVQRDAGLNGSWFEGEVIGHAAPDQCVVRYDELHEGDDSAADDEVEVEVDPPQSSVSHAEAMGHCEKDPACTRGFKHGGKGGRCSYAPRPVKQGGACDAVAEAAANGEEALGQCEKDPACTRGFKHGGKGGRCSHAPRPVRPGGACDAVAEAAVKSDVEQANGGEVDMAAVHIDENESHGAQGALPDAPPPLGLAPSANSDGLNDNSAAEVDLQAAHSSDVAEAAAKLDGALDPSPAVSEASLAMGPVPAPVPVPVDANGMVKQDDLHDLAPDHGAIAGAESAVEGTAVDGTAVDGTAVEGTAVEGNAFEGNAVEGNAVEGNAVEGNAVEGNASEENSACQPCEDQAGAGDNGAWDVAEYGPLYESAEPLERIRPVPPAFDGQAAHAAWAQSLTVGAALDLKFDGGWWHVELVEIRSALDDDETEDEPTVAPVAVNMADKLAEVREGEDTGGVSTVRVTGSDAADGIGNGAGVLARQYLVRSVDFDVEHLVEADSLRPAHAWDRESETWSLRPPPQLYVAASKANTKKKRGRAAMESASPAATEGSGEPDRPAKAFALGTRRKGRDGNEWEVDLVRGGHYVWVQKEAPSPSSSKSRRRQ